jgi:hypothetical protein
MTYSPFTLSQAVEDFHRTLVQPIVGFLIWMVQSG